MYTNNNYNVHFSLTAMDILYLIMHRNEENVNRILEVYFEQKPRKLLNIRGKTWESVKRLRCHWLRDVGKLADNYLKPSKRAAFPD